MSSADSAPLFRVLSEGLFTLTAFIMKLANYHIIKKGSLHFKNASSVDEAGSRMIRANINAFM